MTVRHIESFRNVQHNLVADINSHTAYLGAILVKEGDWVHSCSGRQQL